jgi:CheY-like chemotaxis protein
MVTLAVMSSRTLLLVEDDPSVRESLSDLLQMEGYQVVEARHGGEALEALRAGLHPCVILLDLMMPIMNGWEFRAAQSGDPEIAAIPVIVLSATRNLREALPPVRPAAFLSKPVEYDTLLATLREYCESC